MQKLILLKLADNADQKGACWPSLATIATECGCSVRTVSRAISSFEDQSILSHSRRFNKSNMYQFNMDTVSSLGSNEDTVSSQYGHHVQSMRTPCPTNMDTDGQLTVKNHKGTVNESEDKEISFFAYGVDLRTIRATTLQGQKRTREQLEHIAKLQSEGHTID